MTAEKTMKSRPFSAILAVAALKPHGAADACQRIYYESYLLHISLPFSGTYTRVRYWDWSLV